MRIRFETPLVVIHQQAVNHRITFAVDDLKYQGEHMASTMQAGTNATVTVAWKDKTGGAAQVDGPTTWTSSDPKMVAVSAAPPKGDPNSATLTAPGPIGKCQVHANADADLGSGVQPVTATIEIEVISGQAVGGEITFTPDTGNPPKGAAGGGPLRR